MKLKALAGLVLPVAFVLALQKAWPLCSHIDPSLRHTSVVSLCVHIFFSFLDTDQTGVGLPQMASFALTCPL